MVFLVDSDARHLGGTKGALDEELHIAGMMISFSFDTPTGATVVLVNLALFIVFWVVSKVLRR